MNKKEKKVAIEKAQALKPGDLILIRTPSTSYDLFRQLGSHTFDHIVQFLIKILFLGSGNR